MCHTANSPASSHSESFGDSASIVGLRKEEGSQESSPATLLFRDQRQFYQNMLVRKCLLASCSLVWLPVNVIDNHTIMF